MYTLKVQYTRHESPSPKEPLVLVDEFTEFIPADEIRVLGPVLGDEVEKVMAAWDTDSYENSLGAIYYEGASGPTTFNNGRLITVKRDGTWRWILASRAWLLGPDGKTIERVAP